MFDVVALGELLIDFTCVSQDNGGYPVMAAHPGGAPANFLAALAKMGMKTAQLGKVGNDAFEHRLIQTLAEAQIRTDGILVDDAVFTTLAFVTLDESGNREFSFSRKPGADTCLTKEEIRTDLIDQAKVFHFGTLSLTDDPAREATQFAVAYARAHHKLITFDPNLRKPLWKDLNEAKAQIDWGLSQADIVKISDEEVDFLWNLSPEEGAEKLLRDYPVQLAFVTCGSSGCVYQNSNAKGHMPAMTGIHVVDTTGAGDIFGGSAVGRILQIGKRPGELSDTELRDITHYACTAAGLSTTQPGGLSSVPSPETVCAALLV